jgi:hypothetical protein
MSTKNQFYQFRKGKREITAPSRQLLASQRAILPILYRHLPVSDHCFSYRKGLSRPIEKLAKSLNYMYLQGDVLVHLDITAFFPSIKEAKVFNLVAGTTALGKDTARLVVALSCYEGHLTVGSAISPLISNSILYPVDLHLSQAAGAKSYARYSDDLFIVGKNYREACRLHCITEELLYSSGFMLNHLKTEYNPRTVLGVPV